MPWSRFWTIMKEIRPSQLVCESLFLRHEIEKGLRAVDADTQNEER